MLFHNTIWSYSKHRSIHYSKHDFALDRASMEFIVGFVDGSCTPSTLHFKAIRHFTIQRCHTLWHDEMLCHNWKMCTPTVQTSYRVKFCKIWYTWSSLKISPATTHLMIWHGMTLDPLNSLLPRYFSTSKISMYFLFPVQQSTKCNNSNNTELNKS